MTAGIVSGAMAVERDAEWIGRRLLVTGTSGDLDLVLTDALSVLGARVVVERGLCESTPAAVGYEDMLASAQRAVGELAGLDGIVTLSELTGAGLEDAAVRDRVEAHCTDVLAAPLAAMRVARNRMETTWIRGTVVAVLVIPGGLSPHAALVARIARSLLVDMVRHEAARVAPAGISVRAVIVDQAATADMAAAVAAIIEALAPSAASLTGVAVEVDGCC